MNTEKKCKWLLIWSLVAAAGAARADGLSDLIRFMTDEQSGRAEFTQTVIVPSKNGVTAKPKISEGKFEFVRPGKFKFDYQKPYAQLIMANGKTLWFYDPDLNQVTEKKQSAALESSPASLLVWSKNATALKANFVLKDVKGKNEKWQWVEAIPKAKDTGLQSIRVGFNDQGELAAMVTVDSFGQQSELLFKTQQFNIKIPETTFDFKVPSGAAVLKE